MSRIENAFRLLLEETDNGTQRDEAALMTAGRRFARRLGLWQPQATTAALRTLQLAPSEVIDVGVDAGTPFLYDAFPDARFLLVDPQRGLEERLTARPRDYAFLNVGLSDAPGRLVLNAGGSKSSYLDRTELTRAEVATTYETPVTTLDAVIREWLTTDRIGIKVDTEGFEDRVLAGLDSERERVRFVLAEVSVLRRFVGSYTFSDLVALLRDRGLHFYGILNPSRIPSPRFYDVLFLRRDDPLFEGPPPPRKVG